jgi:hypothetical protein
MLLALGRAGFACAGSRRTSAPAPGSSDGDGVLLAASLIAILTTLGIVLSLLFEACASSSW